MYTYFETNDGYRSIQACIRGQTAHIYPKDIKKWILPPKEELMTIEKT